MAYVESHQQISRHPKTKKAARLLGVSVPTIIGHLHILWHWCLDYAQDGNLSRYGIEEIADAAMWDKEPNIFINALIETSFIDVEEDDVGKWLMVHDWMEYGGKLVVKRKADAERKKTSPKKPVINQAPDIQRNSIGCPPEIQWSAQVDKSRLDKSRKEESTETRAGEPNFDDEFPYRPNIESPLALAVRNVCRKGIVLSIRDREKLERVLCGLEKENATVEQVEEFGRKCVNYWIGRDSRTKQPRPPDITQVLEHWHAVLDLPEPSTAGEIKPMNELMDLQAKYANKTQGGGP